MWEKKIPKITVLVNENHFKQLKVNYFFLIHMSDCVS